MSSLISYSNVSIHLQSLSCFYRQEFYNFEGQTKIHVLNKIRAKMFSNVQEILFCVSGCQLDPSSRCSDPGLQVERGA